MRLTETEIIAGLAHPNIHVREPLLDYFGGQHAPPLELTAAMIALVDQYGWDDALHWPHKIKMCRHDETSLAWCLDEIDKLAHAATSGNNRPSTLPAHLVSWAVSAPVGLLTKVQHRIASIPAFQTLQFRDKKTPLQRIHRRIEIASLDAQQAWEQIDEKCRSIANVRSFAEAGISDAVDLLEPILADGDNFRDQLLDILRHTGSDQDGAHQWMVGLMIILAGRLRFADALPHLLARFEHDWNWYNEQIIAAITRIGTAEVHRKVIEYYPGKPRYVCNYLSDPLEKIHYDGAAESVFPLIDEEDDDGLKVQLAVAMTSHFDDYAIGPATEFYYENSEDIECQAIIENLHALACLAKIDLPDLESWRHTIEDDWKRFEKSRKIPAELVAKLAHEANKLNDRKANLRPDPPRILPPNQPHRSPPLPSPQEDRQSRVGRNDACPCGSGRKYKKCCMRAKQS